MPLQAGPPRRKQGFQGISRNSSGPAISRQQSVAIALSEARKHKMSEGGEIIDGGPVGTQPVSEPLAEAHWGAGVINQLHTLSMSQEKRWSSGTLSEPLSEAAKLGDHG